MRTLTPSSAAAIARGVYSLRENTVTKATIERGELLGCEGMFTCSDKSRFEGRSGALAWKKMTGFGYIAAGEGQYQGDVIVVTRGTVIGADWMSNLNMGMHMGPGGWPVHAGFGDVWKSVAPEIRSFMQGRNPARIHCVGHSLGGALATLNADMLSAAGVADVALYTFGCPRTGDGTFVRSLTRRIGAKNIFRVSHPADPVPMIPLFPFWHLPMGGNGLSISNAAGSIISVGAHSMVPSYIPGVANQTWESLAAMNQADDDLKTKSWLETAAQGHSGFVKGSASLLTMIGKALTWILAKTGLVALSGLGVGLAVGGTLLDQLAGMLARGVQLSKEIGGYMRTLIRAIFAFVGRTVSASVDLTTAFLRWTLELLYSALYAVASRAVDMLR